MNTAYIIGGVLVLVSALVAYGLKLRRDVEEPEPGMSVTVRIFKSVKGGPWATVYMASGISVVSNFFRSGVMSQVTFKHEAQSMADIWAKTDVISTAEADGILKSYKRKNFPKRSRISYECEIMYNCEEKFFCSKKDRDTPIDSATYLILRRNGSALAVWAH